MKQIKQWQYIGILYLAIFLIDTVVRVFNVYQDHLELPYGWMTVILGIMVGCLVDLPLVYLLGLLIEYILRKLTDDTLEANLVITLVSYIFIKHFIM